MLECPWQRLLTGGQLASRLLLLRVPYLLQVHAVSVLLDLVALLCLHLGLLLLSLLHGGNSRCGLRRLVRQPRLLEHQRLLFILLSLVGLSRLALLLTPLIIIHLR